MSSRTVRSSRGVVGLDIGGANLKAAIPNGDALTVPFALWREPQQLAARLRALLRRLRPGRLAVTMTGELCDCFATKRAGVHAILDSIKLAAPKTPILVWSTHGQFVTVDEARVDPWRVASANWHALATFAGRFAPEGAGLLIDIGSTTTDIIPLQDGKPAPRGLTDPERLASGELLYTGVRRTPVCAVLSDAVAAELFATMHDVYLILGQAPEEPENCDTADGRPSTRAAAHARLARMLCDDAEHFPWRAAQRLARQARRRQIDFLTQALARVAARLPDTPRTIVLSGCGEFLARAALRACRRLRGARVVSLGKELSPAASTAACAHALAFLAAEPLDP
jgi:hypothetical protein